MFFFGLLTFWFPTFWPFPISFGLSGSIKKILNYNLFIQTRKELNSGVEIWAKVLNFLNNKKTRKKKLLYWKNYLINNEITFRVWRVELKSDQQVRDVFRLLFDRFESGIISIRDWNDGAAGKFRRGKKISDFHESDSSQVQQVVGSRHFKNLNKQKKSKIFKEFLPLKWRNNFKSAAIPN